MSLESFIIVIMSSVFLFLCVSAAFVSQHLVVSLLNLYLCVCVSHVSLGFLFFFSFEMGEFF